MRPGGREPGRRAGQRRLPAAGWAGRGSASGRRVAAQCKPARALPCRVGQALPARACCSPWLYSYLASSSYESAAQQWRRSGRAGADQRHSSGGFSSCCRCARRRASRRRRGSGTGFLPLASCQWLPANGTRFARRHGLRHQTRARAQRAQPAAVGRQPLRRGMPHSLRSQSMLSVVQMLHSGGACSGDEAGSALRLV